MQQRNHIPFIAAAILTCIAVYALYPYYQYYIDPDATGYLTVSRRYLEGDYLRAINGYWSPWSCWLVAALCKVSGFGLMKSAVIVNTTGAIGFLFITHSFLGYFRIQGSIQWLVEMTLVVFLSYAVYGQLFDDLWECFFLLGTLRIMLRADFSRRPILWVSTGLAGTLAYFAKAYSFPFFILNTTVCSFLITRAWIKENRNQWLKICAVSITVMIAGSLPWIYALHERYGEWMTGTAGKLNLSWYVLGHPVWEEGITYLIPPAHSDSPLYWEDPYMANGPTPNGFSSLHMLKLQLIRIPYNLVKMVDCMNQLSALFVAAGLVLTGIACSTKLRSYFPQNLSVAGISFILFPLAFVLMNFEARYMWYMLPLNIVMAALLLQKATDFFRDNIAMRLILFAAFAISYAYRPIWELKQMFRVGEEDHRVAERMQRQGIRGSFTAIAKSGAQVNGLERIAYFSGNPFYHIPYPNISPEELSAEMERYGVQYYVYFYNKAESEHFRFTDGQGRELPEVMRDEAYGIRVFKSLR